MSRPAEKTWFESMFGFEERQSSDRILQYLRVKPSAESVPNGALELTSTLNGKSYLVGTFSTPSLQFLRDSAKPYRTNERKQLKCFHIAVDDILETHSKKPLATFQVASQFNCLEFPHPRQVPEDGVTSYALDPTQGPACSLACAGATVYRNYFLGQTKDHQINTLSGLESLCFPTAKSELWNVKNGYLISDQQNLMKFNAIFQDTTTSVSELQWIPSIQVGWQNNCQVTFAKRGDPEWVPLAATPPILVSQVFCSAVPVNYNDPRIPVDQWKNLCQLVLCGSYEATLLCAALDKYTGRGSGEVFLTFVGAGAFGNKMDWIIHAIAKALKMAADLDLSVYICHRGEVNTTVATSIDRLL